MKKRTYTRKWHAYCLERFLNEIGDICSACPATYASGDHGMSNFFLNDPCTVCRAFVDIRFVYGCPCHIIGLTRVRLISLVALDQYSKETSS